MYSLPGNEDPVRKKIYRSIHGRPTGDQRAEGKKELAQTLHRFVYQGVPLPETLTLSAERPVADYFRQFPGLDARMGDYNPDGFWTLPVPVMSDIHVDPGDAVIYDAQGYEALRSFLKKAGIRHVLLAGYNTDMCVRSTTAGYQNLRKDFNVFLVGDATMATSPANITPAHATNAAVSFAALDLLITQVSWIRSVDPKAAGPPAEEGKAGRDVQRPKSFTAFRIGGVRMSSITSSRRVGRWRPAPRWPHDPSPD
ncbi:MAG: cysteine hydrolase family protein [Pirellulaceae bacterium]